MQPAAATQARTTHNFGSAVVVTWDAANNPEAARDLRRSMALMGTLGCDLEFSQGRVRAAIRGYRRAQARASAPAHMAGIHRFQMTVAQARADVRAELVHLRAVNARVEAA